MPGDERDLGRARLPCHLPLERQMTEKSIPRSDFYVYALFREDGSTPFYIGKGRGNRINIHESQTHRFTSHKDRIIQGMIARGIAVPKIKLIEGITDDVAKQVETDLIALIGRSPSGPLANLTSGGDGVSNLSKESRAKKSAANVASWNDDTVRAKRLAGLAAVWTPERRAQHGAQVSNKSEETRKKMSVGRKAAWIKQPRYASEETRRLKSLAGKASWADPETRKRRCEASRQFQSTAEYRAKRSDIAKKIWVRRKAQKTLPSGNASESQPPPNPPGPSS
jgi:hypothetical protein